MALESLSLKREATIELNDVFGPLPLQGEKSRALPDFDASLTARVRNTGRFRDRQFSIGAWPATGDYGAVLLAQLRGEQAERAANLLGITNPNSVTCKDLKQLHPDDVVLVRSLQRAVVGVVNSAARTKLHSQNGTNGSDFYVGTAPHNLEIYAQLPFFRGLAARGLLQTLHRIPNDAGVWQPDEQFRSSWASQVRRDPSVLEEVDIASVPPITQTGRLAWTDKFGNVRLEVADITNVKNLLTENDKLWLTAAGTGSLALRSETRLASIEHSDLSIYANPTEHGPAHGPGYVELSRRVDDPNINDNHAYAALVEFVNGSQTEGFDPACWETIDFQLAA